jgi:GcrA cell cycle regulator
MQSNWAPAHSAALREYFAKGMSFSAIADAINAKFNTSYSRNATLGRATRMGLAGSGRREGCDQPRDRFKSWSNSSTAAATPKLDVAELCHLRVRTPFERLWRPPVFESVEMEKLRMADIVPRHLSLMDLERSDCRYPYGGDAEGEAITFCGHPRRPGSRYCAAHFQLSTRPATASEKALDRIVLRVVATA